MFEGGPQSVLRIGIDDASQGLEQPLGGILGIAHDLSCDEPALLIESGLVEVGFEQFDERAVPVFVVGGRRRRRRNVPYTSGSIGGPRIGVGVGIFVFGIGVLLNGASASGSLLGFDLLGTHQGQEVDVGVLDGDGVDRKGAEHDGGDFMGNFC